MKEQYLTYYRKPSWKAWWTFIADSLMETQAVRKRSLLNRQKDYLALWNNSTLLGLHTRLNECLLHLSREWPDHDYGEGYFYQSLEALHISGLRSTSARIQSMDLKTRLQGKRVLDIGCNAGFVDLSVCDDCQFIVGLDINPFWVEIGRYAAEFMGKKNCAFIVSRFEEYSLGETFDAVLSFANHSTYDGNMEISLEEYFDRCARHLKSAGIFLFESHHPSYEDQESLEKVVLIIEKYFRLTERNLVTVGTFFDRGRTFLAALKK